MDFVEVLRSAVVTGALDVDDVETLPQLDLSGEETGACWCTLDLDEEGLRQWRYVVRW